MQGKKVDDQHDPIGGLAQLIISRQENNRILVASYLVDYWCLGIKATIPPRKMGTAEYQAFKETSSQQFNQPLVAITLEQAQSIIYGAADYARTLGFEPHRDFNAKAQAHLGLRPETLIPIEFGKNGQPFYISGPYDNADKIIKTLEKSVGEGNFHYVFPLGGNEFLF